MPRIYLASGWFNDRDDRILTSLEDLLTSCEEVRSVYRPRVDGVKLEANMFHDHELRKKVFEDNVRNIDAADVVVANLDCGSPRLDTGTVWEVAYALESSIPVFIYEGSSDSDPEYALMERLGSLVSLFKGRIYTDMDTLLKDVLRYHEENAGSYKRSETKEGISERICFLPLPEDDETYVDLMRATQETAGNAWSYISNYYTSDLQEAIRKLRDHKSESSLALLPIESKSPILTFFLGVCYKLGIPTVTYTRGKDGVNLMLICSVLRHVIGEDDLVTTLNQIYRVGPKGLVQYDSSGIQVY